MSIKRTQKSFIHIWKFSTLLSHVTASSVLISNRIIDKETENKSVSFTHPKQFLSSSTHVVIIWSKSKLGLDLLQIIPTSLSKSASSMTNIGFGQVYLIFLYFKES